jgi:hypothetical protein
VGAFTEFGLNSHIGRTLEKSGVAVASPDPAFFAHSAALVLEALRNELPGMAPPEEREVSFFLSGLVQRMKTKGALYHPELEEYIRRGGEGYLISKERKPWMPSYGSGRGGPSSFQLPTRAILTAFPLRRGGTGTASG